MKLNKPTAIIATVLLACTLTTGFGIKDLTKEVVPDTDKCKTAKDKTKCDREEYLESAAAVAALGLAAKMIYDMVIEYKTKPVSDEETVVNAYKAKHKTLPEKPTVVSYTTSLKPGQVVKPGKPVLLVSKLEVVPGKKGEPVLVQEKIAIHDNEDNKKVIKSLVKGVNEASKKGGTFENEFSFILPDGMPQGVYPVQTAVLLNEQELNQQKNEMQVVLQQLPDGQYQISLVQ
jgi:hypothetical protein